MTVHDADICRDLVHGYSSNCRWYFDFQLPSEVLVKKSAKFERKFADCKNLHRYFGISAWTTCSSYSYFVHTVINWCALCFFCACISLN